MNHVLTSRPHANPGPDHLIKNSLHRDELVRDADRNKPLTDQAHDPGTGLLTNPLDKPGARDNLIKNPLDRQ